MLQATSLEIMGRITMNNPMEMQMDMKIMAIVMRCSNPMGL